MRAERNLQWGRKSPRDPMSQDPQPQPCSACPNSPQGGAPGCESGSGPEAAAGTLAAAAATSAAAFPPPRSQSISAQCRLPQPCQAREKEGGPRIGCELPRGPGPASPPMPPLQHRGQRPARALRAQPSPEPCAPLVLVSQLESGMGAALRFLIPSAFFPPTQGGRLCPSRMRSKSKGCQERPPASPRRT